MFHQKHTHSPYQSLRSGDKLKFLLCFTECQNYFLSPYYFLSTHFFSVLFLFLSQPKSLVANLLAGPSTLGSVHFGRESYLINQAAAGVGDRASALRSLSPISSSLHLRGSLNAAHRTASSHTSAMNKTMAGSGWEKLIPIMLMFVYTEKATWKITFIYLYI